MNALWRPEAKSNRALFNVIDLTCRYIETPAQQGLRVVGKFQGDLTVDESLGELRDLDFGGRRWPANGQQTKLVKAKDPIFRSGLFHLPYFLTTA